MLTATIDPTEVGFDPARLDRIDDFVTSRYLDTGRYPGYSLLVARHGQIAHVSHHGYEPDAVFRIYSMSKPITSLALLQLIEAGHAKLGDPVSAFIPSWADLRVFVDGTPKHFTTRFPEREMCIQDLLTHTAGLTYGWMYNHPVDAMYRDSAVQRTPGSTLTDMVDELAQLPLLFSPGTSWHYSVATDVCGALVEIISGQSLDAYLDEHILGPLGMVDTGFVVDDTRAERFTSNYAVASLSPFGVPEGAASDSLVNDATVMIDDGGETSPYRSMPSFLSGGGGLVSTLSDYYRFCRMLLGGGDLDGHRVIGRKTLEFATSNHLPDGRDLAAMGQPVFSETTYTGVGFGLGFSVMLDPAQAQVISSPGEFAWGGAASTLFWVDPAEQLIVIGLTQLMPSSAYPIRQEMKALVYGALT